MNTVDEILKTIDSIEGSVKVSKEHEKFLSDLFRFIKGVIPIMMQVRVTVAASTDHIPEASENINHVSSTTESATNEVMDKLDIVMNNISALDQEIGEYKTDKSAVMMSEMTNSISDIMNALQFQDITSQKLEHTSLILNTIYDRFLGIFDSLLNAENESDLGRKVMDSANAQEQNDIKNQVEDKVHSNGISQADIDQFFN